MPHYPAKECWQRLKNQVSPATAAKWQDYCETIGEPPNEIKTSFLVPLYDLIECLNVSDAGFDREAD